MGYRGGTQYGDVGLQPHAPFQASPAQVGDRKKRGKSHVQHALQTLRYKRFARAAYITTESQKTILNISMAIQKRAWMQGLCDPVKAFDLPAEFADSQPH
jgi:hypothetical protein